MNIEQIQEEIQLSQELSKYKTKCIDLEDKLKDLKEKIDVQSVQLSYFKQAMINGGAEQLSSSILPPVSPRPKNDNNVSQSNSKSTNAHNNTETNDLKLKCEKLTNELIESTSQLELFRKTVCVCVFCVSHCCLILKHFPRSQKKDNRMATKI
jgi:hypothetical protein